MEFRPVWLSDLSLSMSKLLPSTKRCKKCLRGDKDEHLNEYVLHRHRQICHSGASEHAAGRQMTKVSFDQGFIWPTFFGKRQMTQTSFGQHDTWPTFAHTPRHSRTMSNPWSNFDHGSKSLVIISLAICRAWKAWTSVAWSPWPSVAWSPWPSVYLPEQASLLLTQCNPCHLRATQSLFSCNRHNSVISGLAVEPRGSSWTARKKMCVSLLIVNWIFIPLKMNKQFRSIFSYYS